MSGTAGSLASSPEEHRHCLANTLLGLSENPVPELLDTPE
jgi:hypothetical protein